MIILRTPKGWTAPKEVDGLKTEDSWRSHQVPFSKMATEPEHITLLENWMKGYKPEELVDENGTLLPELLQLAPEGERRRGANRNANGGLSHRDLKLPDFARCALAVPRRGAVLGAATRVLGNFLRDVMQLHQETRNFRIMGPDETAWARCSTRQIAPGGPMSSPRMIISRRTVA